MSDECSRRLVFANRFASTGRRSSKSSRSFYKMDHPRRGVAAIFNHVCFDNVFNQRQGSDKDVESLVHTLSSLGFDVETFIDLTFTEVMSCLESLSRRDHSKCDCFLLVYMSHGLEGLLRAKDIVFNVNCLWECFTPEQAPSLVNKPKIFIIQACQGHGKQVGVRVVDHNPDSSVDGSRCTLVPGYSLPSSPDFLVALSTIPGFVSWRNPLEGSWYIQTLCKHLDSLGYEQDLITLLTHVGRQIAIEYSAIDFQDPENPIKKQLPSIISFLVKKVQFTNQRTSVCGSKRKFKSLDCSSKDTVKKKNVNRDCVKLIESTDSRD